MGQNKGRAELQEQTPPSMQQSCSTRAAPQPPSLPPQIPLQMDCEPSQGWGNVSWDFTSCPPRQLPAFPHGRDTCPTRVCCIKEAAGALTRGWELGESSVYSEVHVHWCHPDSRCCPEGPGLEGTQSCFQLSSWMMVFTEPSSSLKYPSLSPSLCSSAASSSYSLRRRLRVVLRAGSPR